MADGKRPKARTIAFYKLMVEDESGVRTAPALDADDWDQALTNLASRELKERIHEVHDERLIGRPFLVESEYGLRIMTPRSEDSWLAILNYSPRDSEEEAEAFLTQEDRDLVETSVVAFVPGLNNVFGLVKGSGSSPTHASVAAWLTAMLTPGKGLHFVAQPCVSRSVQEQLEQSGGVASTTVRVKTNAADELGRKGMEDISHFLRRIGTKYGEMIVTMTFKVPAGTSKGHKLAREQLKQDTETLTTVVGVEGLKANLVLEDQARRRRQEVNFVEQRITVKTLIPTHDDDGNVIREDSAVRQIRVKGTEESVYVELRAADSA